MKLLLIIFLFITSLNTEVYAQVVSDSSLVVKSDTVSIKKKDTASAKAFNPRVATFRSAVLPGWGQAYNKKYWKIPVVYLGLGIAAGTFINNLTIYKKLRTAYIYRTDTIASNDADIDPRFKNLSSESIRSYRNTFRQNMDYSVLAFLIIWGLNVVDATVDAHLKGFDVSDDLTLKIIPGKSRLGNTTGVSLVLRYRDKPSRSLTSGIR